MPPTSDISPSGSLGVFDSGVGGLSILGEVRRQLPAEDLLYIADQAHVPYGARPLQEVRGFAEAITNFLLQQGAKLIVVACNTASAAALHDLRQTFPGVSFVGMEPAVKPAAETTRSGKVGVLATPATFQGALYGSVVERFARGVTLLQDTCPGLVAEIEAGRASGPAARRILERALQPMLAAGIDTVVLGCTHYPFVSEQIAEIAGPQVRLIDPAPAVARQVGRVLAARNLFNNSDQAGQVRLYTTGDLDGWLAHLPEFWPEAAENGLLRWAGGELAYAAPARP